MFFLLKSFTYFDGGTNRSNRRMKKNVIFALKVANIFIWVYE